jgi:hypothetical protein
MAIEYIDEFVRFNNPEAKGPRRATQADFDRF